MNIKVCWKLIQTLINKRAFSMKHEKERRKNRKTKEQYAVDLV